jgi:inner membrane protein
MRNSATARLVVMTVLTVALLIPIAWVQIIVSERAGRRDVAAAEIGTTWGGPQLVTGPVLAVPYTVVWEDNTGRRGTCRAMFLPKDLRIEGTLRAETRTRGIFDVIVYHTQLKVSGRFTRPDANDIPSDAIDWSRATLNVGVSDPRGLTRRGSLKWNGQDLQFTGGVADVGLMASGLQAALPPLDRLQGTEVPFEMTLELNGTRDLRFVPSAAETTVALDAAWPHPSFVGKALPETRQISADGFRANWQVQDFGRPFPSRWKSNEVNREQLLAQANESAFGLALVQPVDIYQQAERAVKYAVLFVSLTFLVFFLWEVFHASLLHPMQYAFIGFALCIFYLLLVSLSEHTGFDVAYVASAGVTTLLIAGYARSVLGGLRQGLSVCAALAALYGFLYLLLRLEDYALLAGSVGLFLILAVVMFITRRMNWYELKLGATPESSAF